MPTEAQRAPRAGAARPRRAHVHRHERPPDTADGRRGRIPRRLGAHGHARLGPGVPAHHARPARRTTARRREFELNALRTSLPRSPDSTRTARRLVREHATTLGSQRREDATLLASELVTNALVHGIGTITLRIDVEPAALRVEVSDEGNVTLAPSPTPGAHGGWGLR